MPSPMSVAEREHLAQQYAADLAPALRSAIDKQDVGLVAELIGGLDRQQLLVLVVTLASRWPAKTKPRPRRYVTCWGCDERKRHEGHGLCRGCHVRWDEAGRPDSGPPPATPREERLRMASARWVEKAADRVEDYGDLASWHVDDEEAAERLGVSVRTVHRYREQLRDAPLQLRICSQDQQRKAS